MPREPAARLNRNSENQHRQSRRLADSLVQNGYDYDPSVARDIASKVVALIKAFHGEQIKDLV